MSNQKLKRLIFKSYLKVIENSVNTNIFRNYYAKIRGKIVDAMQDGYVSCAFFVSSILLIFNLIKNVHWTVEGTVKDLENHGWYRIRKVRKGCVLVWETVIGVKDKLPHKHIGFYIGNYQAVSNNPKKGRPTCHHYTFNNKRKIEAIYWNKSLEEK